MATIYTLTEYINRALDKQYTSLFANVLKQIRTLSTARNAPIQRALLDLDNEAKRLVDENKRIDPENPALKNAITQHQNSLVTTATLIQSNDDAIQNAAVRLAVAAVTSKVFTSLAGVIIEQGIDPVSERALGSYMSILSGRNVKWLAPTGVDFARGFVDSAAWISKMEGWGAGYAGLTRDVILDGISNGWSPLKVAQEMRNHAENIPTHAADNLMRTLQLTSYREASAAMELVNGAYLRGKVRIATLDDKTCLNCISLHGTSLEVGERVDDHYRGRCELPGNIISGATIKALVSRHYNGDVVVIRTASGKLLPVTPNHPILTDRGWISAKLIQIGDNVVNYAGSERASDMVNPNKQHIPTAVENISTSLGMRKLGTMPITSKDFHGDGIDGDIGIIWANSLLRNIDNVSFIKPRTKQLFGFRSLRDFFPGLCNFDFMFHGKGNASSRFLSSFYNFLLFSLGHLASSQSIGFSLSSPFNIVDNQSCFNYTSRNSKFFSDSILRNSRIIHSNNIIRDRVISNSSSRDFLSLDSPAFNTRSKEPLTIEIITKSLIASVKGLGRLDNIDASQIKFDRVVEIGNRSFSGHVYSLQSNKGWYISNDIISHNCSEFYQTIGGPDFPDTMQADSKPGQRNFVPFQTGEEWFNSLSPERRAMQRSFMTNPAKLKAFNSGIPLSDFVGDHIDPVFGHQTVELSLIKAIGDDANKFYTKMEGIG